MIVSFEHLKQQGFATRLFFCALLGGLSAFAMAPYDFFPLLFVSLSFLYLAVSVSETPTRAFMLGWMFAFVYFVVGLFWVRNALLVEGNPYAWVWPLAVAGLPALLAFFTAFGCLLARRFADLETIPGFIAFASFIGFFEWARGYAFTGFPWNLYGHTWAGVPQLLQILSFADAYWLTWLTVLWTALPGFWIVSNSSLKNKKILSLTLALIFVFSFSFGFWRLQQPMPPARDDVQIHLVQANIPQSEKWKRENLWPHYVKHIELSKAGNAATSAATYIVWAETALSQWVLDDPRSMQMIRRTLSEYKGPAYLITGLLRYDEYTEGFYNSLIMIDKEGTVTNIYDKNHLVPFGEYIPFQNWIPLKPVARFRGFSGGEGPLTFRTPEHVRYSPVICYEIIFAGKVVKRDDRPDFILNVTNDSWYGDTAGPRQHLQQAVFRAIEEGIPVVRVADTGISAVIDPFGHIIEKSGLFEKYEKTLALPRPNVVSMKNNTINTVLFIALHFLLTAFSFSRNGKIKKRG